MLRALLFCLLLCWGTSALAETRYITDQLVISLRQDQDDRSTPLERLATGTAVEVIADLGSHLKVKTASGAVGYIRSQYLSTLPPKTGAGQGAIREQLAAEQQKNIALASELEQLKTATASGNSPLQAELERTRAELVAANQRLQAQSDSGTATVLAKERAEHQQQLSRLNEELQTLRTRSKNGEGGHSLSWFLAGAAVFFVGWLAGKSSRQKRRF